MRKDSHGCPEHHHKKDLNLFLQKLKAGGLKLTKQREAMAAEILHFRKPFTVEELHEALGKLKNIDVDLVTVYRCLARFSGLGLLSTHDFGDGSIRYESMSDDGHHHHHVICQKCERVDPVNFCVIQGQEVLLQQMGYSNLTHRLEFFGICPDCAKSKK